MPGVVGKTEPVRRLAVGRGSRQCVPRGAAASVPGQMSARDQLPEVRLERVAADAGEPDHLADADAAMLACVVEDPYGQIRQIRQHQLFAFELPNMPIVSRGCRRCSPVT